VKENNNAFFAVTGKDVFDDKSDINDNAD